MTKSRSETRTDNGWHSFDRIAGLVSLGLVSLLLVISLARGTLGGGDSAPLASAPLRSDQVDRREPAAPEPMAAVPGAEAAADSASGSAASPAAAGALGSGVAASMPPQTDARAPLAQAAPGLDPTTLPAAGGTVERIPVNPPTTGRDAVAAPPGSGLVKPILELRASDDKLTIDGIIGDEATRRAILQSALQKFGMRNINDRLAVSAGVARFDWSGPPEEIITLVGEPGRATSVKVDGTTITLSGSLPDLDSKESKSLAAQQLFGPSARVTNRIQVGGANAVPGRLAAANSRGAIISADGSTPSAPSAAGVTSEPEASSTDASAAGPAAEPAPRSAAGDAGSAPAAAADAGESEAGEPPEDGSLVLTAEVPTGFPRSECARIATGLSIPFRSGSAELTPDVRAALDAVAPCLERRTYIVGGHTDGRGSEIGNLILSQARAQAVVDYLVASGLPAEQLIATGYGEARPVDTNRTEEGRARNRRIDFRFAP